MGSHQPSVESKKPGFNRAAARSRQVFDLTPAPARILLATREHTGGGQDHYRSLLEKAIALMAQSGGYDAHPFVVAALAILLAYLLTSTWAWRDDLSAEWPPRRRTLLRSLVHLVVLIASLAWFDPASLSAPQ